MAAKCPKCQADNPDTVRFCGECGTWLLRVEDAPSAQTETLEIPREGITTGSTFAGRYQIIEELGKGGMGRVYRAHDTKLNEEVALKLIRPDIASDKQMLERFHNELKLARRVAHRNVGKMYELMEDKGSHFITMEYIPGEDLRSFIKQARQLTIGTAILIAKDICEGLAEAHRLGVIHRDLKPSNIIINREGSARIMDFGIARSLESRGMTGLGMIVGTPEYMSPEQAEGQDVDQRSDIYSLGVILYEMVTGRVPFEGTTPLGIAMKHKTVLPPDPKSINPQVPDDLTRLILRCLAKDKAERFQSATEVLSELNRIEEKNPLEKKPQEEGKPFLKSLFQLMRKRKIIETVAGFMGGGWLVLEVVHWILIDHYHFPEETLDIALVAIIGALICTLIWRFLGGIEKKAGAVSRLFLRAFLIIALAATGVIIWRILPTPHPPQRSVAVLPFIDLSPGKDQEYLCLGISESLINALSRLNNLMVPARTSAFSFKGKDMDIREIGQKLNVEHVLEGSLQVAGDKLRVTAQLISVKNGFHLWSEKYDRRQGDMWAIQDEIAQEIVRALEVRLLAGEKTQLTKRYTDNAEAYNLYLQGRYFWEKRTEESLKRSIEFFQKALEKDPHFALAHAGIADAYSVLGDNGLLPPGQSYPKAKEAAFKALDLDKSLAEAHAAMGTIMADYDWDWAGAEREYKEAIRLKPGCAQAHHWYAFLLMYLGRYEEAIREIRIALNLDPLAPRIAANVGGLLFYARRYDQALEELKKAADLFPDHIAVFHYLADVYTAMGRYEEALSYCRKIKEISGNEPEWITARIYAKWGKKKEAEELLRRLESLSGNGYIEWAILADIHSLLGEADKAFLLLDKAFAERESDLCYLKVDPWLDPLRSDPRFKALLIKMNLDKEGTPFLTETDNADPGRNPT